MSSVKSKVISVLVCIVMCASLLFPAKVVSAAEEKICNAVLNVSSGCYYPGYNMEFTGGTPGRLEPGARLSVEKFVTNSKGTKVAVAYSFDLRRVVYVSSRFVKEVATVSAPLADGYYTISPACAPGLVIDAKDRGTENETPVQIWEAWDTPGFNQIFNVKHIGGGLYTFEASHAEGMMLDVAWGYSESGGTVQLYEENSTLAQSFYLEDAGDGMFYIVSALNKNIVLDVDGGGKSNGVRLQTYARNATNAQKFRFREIPTVYSYNDKTYNVLEGYSDYTYNQNNYPRYVEKGANVGCTAVAMSTAYSIKNPDKAITPNDSSIRWIYGTGVVWTTHCNVLWETARLEQKERFEYIYDLIMEENTPVILRLEKVTNSESGHSVVVVGINEGAERSSLTVNDLLVVDPAGGKIYTLNEAMNGKNKYKVSNSWSLIVPLNNN